MALSQAGSIKMHGGKLDPYSAAATAIALGSPQARAIRRAGQIDPSQGTIGQRLSAGISKSLPDGAMARAFDPTRSVFEATSGGAGSYFENPILAQMDAAQLHNPNIHTASGLPLTNNQTISEYAKTNFDQIAQDTFDQKYGTKRSVRGVNNLTAKEQVQYDKLVQADATNAASGTKTTLAKDFLSSDALAGGTLDNAGFFTKAGEFGSNVAGAIFPGFGKYDPVTGGFIKGSFDFGKALQTVSIAGTVGSLKAIGEELKKQKQLDEEKQREIWSTYFDSYLRTTGRTYDQSMYADPVLLEKYNRFMLASGGRVGYNMGGLTEGIMGSSGVPQGMQVDGRNGAFIPMGVEEKADDVPAMLSKNEFVMTADAVKAAGDGDANKGAQRMYDLMHNLEAQV